MDTQTLMQTLKLERLEVNLFRGKTPEEESRMRIYGGQVIAQSLLAAYETVESRVCHSLHCYFLRSGDPRKPILFDVDRARDGGSFTTRRVVAIQDGKQIFNMSASFKTPEQGFEHQAPLPAVADPETLPSEAEMILRLPDPTPDQRRTLEQPRPVEVRGYESVGPDTTVRDPHCARWMRALAPIGDDIKMQQVILAYATDMGLLPTAFRPHGVYWGMPGLQAASLDHVIWFHQPSDFNGWHLFDMESPKAHGALGLTRGSVFTQDGRLVASIAQEGLMRRRA